MDISQPLSEPQIRWQCRRGMLELDILLLAFFDKVYKTLNAEQQNSFVELLAFPDQILYGWLIGKEQPDTTELKWLVQLIRDPKWKG